MFDRKQLKLEARCIIKEGGFNLKWAVFLFLVLSITISQLVYSISGYSEYAQNVSNAATEYNELYQQYEESGDSLLLNDLETELDNYIDAISDYPRTSSLASTIVVLLLVMNSFLSAGFEWWCLLKARRQKSDFRNMFDGFGFTLKLLGLIALRGLLIFVGFMLLIVPGIYLVLALSQSTYILFEDPSQGVFKCLKKSIQIMKGHKKAYFVMLLSFLGWELLEIAAASYISTLLIQFKLNALSAYSSILIALWLTPYMGITCAGFYNYITGYSTAASQTPLQQNQEDNTL